MIETNLGQVTHITTGKLDANAQDTNGLYPFFTCGEENLTINTAAFDTEAVLLAGNGNFSVKYYKGKFNAYQRTYVIEPNLVDGKWLYYLVMHHIAKITAGARGSTIKYLRIGDITDCTVNLVSLSHQKRIVAKIEELFSELDNGIAALKTAREQLKVYRQAVLKHAFEGKLTAKWREENKDKLESTEQLLSRINAPQQPRGGRQASIEVIEGIAALAVNKPSKLAPDGWTWTPLLRVARQETGHTPSRKHPEYWNNGNEYWIGIADARLHHGKIINDTLQKVTPLGLANSSARTLPAKTVCLSRTASVGYVTITGKPMATSQDFATWTCTEALEPKFLMYALIAEGDEIRRFGKGTTHTTIYFPEIRALHICLPPIEEQRKIIDFIEHQLEISDKTSADIDDQLNKAETLRQSILKKAFSGQLVPQDPSDEPASALLARIKAEKAAKKAESKAADQPKAARKPRAKRSTQSTEVSA